MTTPVFTQEAANALDQLVTLVINPPADRPSLLQVIQETVQLRADVVALQAEVNPGAGTITVAEARDFVQNISPGLQQVEQEVLDIKTKIAALESNLEPTLAAMTAQMQTSLNELADAAKLTKDNAEQQMKDVITAANNKFKTQEEYQSKVIADASSRFREVDGQMAQFRDIATKIVAMRDSDVSAIRQKLAESGLTGRNDYRTKCISEYKAVSNLEHYDGEERIAYKSWTRKLKNAVFQARGPEWRAILDALELHRVSDDFEELTSLDDKWDEWFESKFGVNRVDGKDPVSLQEFKVDLDWIKI